MGKKIAVVTLATLLLAGIVLPWGRILPNSINQKVFNSEVLAKKKKKTKKNYKKVYSFTVSGDCNNSNAQIAWYSSDPDEYNFYRKVAIPEVNPTNMPKIELYHKADTPFSSNVSDELWTPAEASHVTQGYIWISYGGKDDGGEPPVSDCSTSWYSGLGDYKLFIYD